MREEKEEIEGEREGVKVRDKKTMSEKKKKHVLSCGCLFIEWKSKHSK